MTSDASDTGSGPSRAGVRAGAAASLPVLPAVLPFGFIFGTLSVETGFDPLQALVMAAVVIAGASQMAALQLLNDGAPFAVIVATAAAVNLRMAMYSAALVPHWRGVSRGWRALAAYVLHDQGFGLAMTRYRVRPEESPAERIGYYLGASMSVCVGWMFATLGGIAVGEGLPDDWGLEYFVPLAFLSMAAPMIRTRPELAAAATAVAVAVAMRDLPYRSGLFVASAAGIAVGMVLSRRRRIREECTA